VQGNFVATRQGDFSRSTGRGGGYFHPLKGDLAGYWSITVRANWRIIFRFEQGDATDVDLVDYH
jgi:plasmid maintenance system killer protein